MDITNAIFNGISIQEALRETEGKGEMEIVFDSILLRSTSIDVHQKSRPLIRRPVFENR